MRIVIVLALASSLAFGQELWAPFLGCYQTIQVGKKIIPVEDRVTTRWAEETSKWFCGDVATPCRKLRLEMKDAKGTILSSPAATLNQTAELFGSDGVKIKFRGSVYNSAGGLVWEDYQEKTELTNLADEQVYLLWVAKTNPASTTFAEATLQRVACPDLF